MYCSLLRIQFTSSTIDHKSSHRSHLQMALQLFSILT